MSTFDDRKKIHEKQFEHEQDLQFRTHSRRARLAGLWAAEQLGLPEQDAEGYAIDLVRLNTDKGSEAISAKLKTDLEAKNLTISDHRLAKELERLLALAAEQIRQK